MVDPRMYKSTARVGILRACLRLIEDPNRNMFERVLLAIAPLLLVYVISPLDLLPEIVLGPLGLADDTAILVALFLIIRLAVSVYREKRYVKQKPEPQKTPPRKHVESTITSRDV